MRIVGGRLKGIRLSAPGNLPVRPTTDMAKEALFNILNNIYDLEECNVLDLFCGTGNISIEFASRGIAHVTAIDRHAGCVHWIKSVTGKFDLNEISVQKADVFKFLQQTNQQYKIIFADPPYDLPNIPQIPELVMTRNLLEQNGLLIVEHPSLLKLSDYAGFKETRKYGNSSFSFFEPLG